MPDFYKGVAALESITLYQGSHFVDKPHYEKKEQIICAIDGALAIAMVPHVNRQEVYTGELKDSVYYDAQASRLAQSHVSPVNFFMPDRKLFTHFNEVTQSFVHLGSGDCMFIPAFYFHQI